MGQLLSGAAEKGVVERAANPTGTGARPPGVARIAALGGLVVALLLAYLIFLTTSNVDWQITYATAAAIAVAGTYFALVYGPGGQADTAHEVHAELERLERERDFEAELDRAFDQQDTEAGVLTTARAALRRIDPDRMVEIHLVSATKPELRLAASTLGELRVDQSDRIWTPWESVAARQGQVIVYDTTERLDLCPHLRSRIAEPCSAICVPLNVQGKILGVMYAVGPNGEEPDDEAVTRLERIARRTALHVGLTRTLTKTEERPEIDEATGLPQRSVVQEKLRELDRLKVPYSLAICRVDGASAYVERFGQEAYERAIRLLADTLSRSIRPTDMAARSGDDEFIFVFPHTSGSMALQAIERLREALIIGQATRPGPAFTCSFGVVHSVTAGGGTGALARAAQALERAQASGRDRVMMAHAPARNDQIT